MNTLENMELICKRYINKEFGIEEFQSRLETLVISDDQKVKLETARFDSVNRLEEIRFCSLEENFYKYGLEVATSLIEMIRKTRLSSI